VPIFGDAGGEPPVPATEERLAEPGPLAELDGQRLLLQAAERLLDGVDRALACLDEGTYGTCEVCGDALEDDDLERDPLLTHCVAHRQTGD
jgi:RNA polymerase-binding transcription factor DksA